MVRGGGGGGGGGLSFNIGGALLIRMGFWCPEYDNSDKEATK